jgi:hypothetical protein
MNIYKCRAIDKFDEDYIKRMILDEHAMILSRAMDKFEEN